jgi:hypothetical protein
MIRDGDLDDDDGFAGDLGLPDRQVRATGKRGVCK